MSTYDPPESKAFKKTVMLHIMSAKQVNFKTSPVAVSIHCHCKTPKKPANSYPVGDLDNYAKGILDAITQSGAIWHDDKQVVSLVITKQYSDSPCILIGITEATSPPIP